MSMTYTPDQQRVIETENKNILVSAAAGSGKTAVLVERIIRKITDREHPLDIDRLLVVTFTNNAAASMRERIGQAIERELEQHPQDVHLQRQAVLVHQALITTLHSFCLYLVRNHFEQIGLEPDFVVADEATVELLSKEVKDDLLERYFAGADPDFLYMVEYLCHTGRETALEDNIDQLYRRAMSMPFPEEWLAERKKDYDFSTLEEFTTRPAGAFLLSHIQGLLASCREGYEAALKIAMEPDGPYVYVDTLEKELEYLERLCAMDSLEKLREYLPAMEFSRLSTKKDVIIDPGKREAVKNRRTQMKKNLEKLGADFFGKSPQSMEVENAGAKRALDMLVQVTLDYMHDLDRAKREKGYIDFHDMEHMALQILLKSDGQGGFTLTETAESYRQQFQEVMVDEYQDSNLVQEYLTAAVSRDNDRFMVGDVKQSIYQFRLARPELFMAKYHEYANADENSVRIDLKQNFRSRPQVLEAVNSVFSRTMTMESGGIAYDESAALYPGAEFPGEGPAAENPAAEFPGEGPAAENPAVQFPGEEGPAAKTLTEDDISVTADGDYTGPCRAPENARRIRRYDRYACECIVSCGELPQGLDARQLEAYSAAKKIKELLRSGRVVNESRTGLRPVVLEDIVLLFRSPSLYEEAYREVFARENIPLSFVSGSGYFDAKEVQNLVKFLECVENPLTDIPMYGACISLFGGLTEEDLARVQIYDRERIKQEQTGKQEASFETGVQVEGQEVSIRTEDRNFWLPEPESLWGKLHDFVMGSPNDPLSPKSQELRDAIQKYRRQAEYCSVEELLRSILNDFHYREQMRLLPDGGKRAANVELLIERAAQFASRGQHGLFSFVNYVKELHRQEIDYGESSVSEHVQAVRMMSIHKSKGLEFPVVIVGGMAHSYTMRDRQQLLLIDNDLGLGVDYISPARRSKNKTLQKSALSLKMERDILAEEQRIFYVAMTRAKEKLILCGYKKNGEELFEAGNGGDMSGNGSSMPEGSGGLSGKGSAMPQDSGGLSGSGRIMPKEKSLRHKDGTCLLSDILSARSYLDLCLLSHDSDSPIQYQLFTVQDLAENEIVEDAVQAGRKEDLEKLLFETDQKEISESLKTEIMKKNTVLEYQYPWMELTRMNGKTSVSELKLAAMEEELGGVEEMFETERVVPCVPEFIKQTQGLGGTAVGTAYHRVLELTDFTALPDSPGAWEQSMEQMAEKGRLALQQKECISTEKLFHFSESSLAERMSRAARAGTLRKEQSFFLGVPAGEMDGELLLIQGIIDAFFEEEDGVVLLDYKTDRVRDGLELADKYHTQMQYYTRAIEQALGKRVKEIILYSFFLGKEVLVVDRQKNDD
ncbi:MAG: UvrD-helicase domain-containing protein [Lachnospiraceae bacterium]|nr:UvrD-helicase domain-containing protein [Lachnospiraceae bacterium]